ncbi:MAG: hypothetical protein AB7K09_17765 [Planctomycetota bacterium]
MTATTTSPIPTCFRALALAALVLCSLAALQVTPALAQDPAGKQEQEAGAATALAELRALIKVVLADDHAALADTNSYEATLAALATDEATKLTNAVRRVRGKERDRDRRDVLHQLLTDLKATADGHAPAPSGEATKPDTADTADAASGAPTAWPADVKSVLGATIPAGTRCAVFAVW